MIERHGSDVRALSWAWSTDRLGGWIEGWINEDRTAIYMKGDLDLICQTAIAVVETFPAHDSVVLINDSQGILFDVSRMASTSQLTDAVIATTTR